MRRGDVTAPELRPGDLEAIKREDDALLRNMDVTNQAFMRGLLASSYGRQVRAAMAARVPG